MKKIKKLGYVNCVRMAGEKDQLKHDGPFFICLRHMSIQTVMDLHVGGAHNLLSIEVTELGKKP